MEPTLLDRMARNLGPWQCRDASGIDSVLVQEIGTTNRDRSNEHRHLYDDGSITAEAGTISANTAWTAANGPYLANNSITIASGRH